MINGAMLYAAKQALMQKHSVVYDTNSNSATRRREWSAVAKQAGALPVIVWVQTPLEIAKKYATSRDSSENDGTNNADYIEKMAAKIEPPTEDEVVVNINGLETSEQQQISFSTQLQKIIQERQD
jgi:predicted kinase